MSYKKTNPDISLNDFIEHVIRLSTFQSITGKEYQIISLLGSKLNFIRDSSGKCWDLDLIKVHKAYTEINISKVSDFKPYFPRTQSPAMGLLLTTKLLKI